MTRLFTEEILSSALTAYKFTGNEARYLCDVLRLQVGEELDLCDGGAKDFRLEVTKLLPGEVQAAVLSCTPNDTEPPYEVVLFQGLVKGDKMDLIIQKAVELGVASVVPLICDRSIMRLTKEQAPKKCQRWQKIATEAARQCGRGKIPEVFLPVTFNEALETIADSMELCFLPWEGEKSLTLFDLLEPWIRDYPFVQGVKPRIGFFIGPEGGFSGQEVQKALEKDLPTVTLGKRILRTETAGLSVLAALGYRLPGL